MSVQISKLAKCVCSEIMIVSIFDANHPKQRDEYSAGAFTNLEKQAGWTNKEMGSVGKIHENIVELRRIIVRDGDNLLRQSV